MRFHEIKSDILQGHIKEGCSKNANMKWKQIEKKYILLMGVIQFVIVYFVSLYSNTLGLHKIDYI